MGPYPCLYRSGESLKGTLWMWDRSSEYFDVLCLSCSVDSEMLFFEAMPQAGDMILALIFAILVPQMQHNDTSDRAVSKVALVVLKRRLRPALLIFPNLSLYKSLKQG